MSLILKNGQFLIYDEKSKLFRIWIGSMKIKKDHIKTYSKLYEKTNCKIIDCSNKIVIPIFINLHLHLGETLYRPLPHKMSLLEYVKFTEDISIRYKETIENIWQTSANITIDESLKNGVPIISTLRGNTFLSQFNVKAFCGYPIMLGKKLQHIYNAGFDAFKKYCKACKKNVIPGVFLQSLYYNNEDSFKFSIKCYKYCKTFYAVHVAEDEESEKIVVKNWGKRSLDILNENNILNSKTLIIHGNTLNDSELKLLSKKKANLAICPISAKNLKTKIINPNKLENFNINWCIASDGLATGETANLLFQTKELVHENINLQTLMKAITINPQKALGLKKEILSNNSFANFMIIDNVNYCSVEDLLYLILSNNIKIDSIYFKGKIIKGDTT